jgi:RNA polymerase-binding transcription factor DksA
VEERYESQLALSARVLDGVDRALERLSAGTYHSCETCGAPLLDADLAADPTRRGCGVHEAPSADFGLGEPDLDAPDLGSF